MRQLLVSPWTAKETTAQRSQATFPESHRWVSKAVGWIQPQVWHLIPNPSYCHRWVVFSRHWWLKQGRSLGPAQPSLLRVPKLENQRTGLENHSTAWWEESSLFQLWDSMTLSPVGGKMERGRPTAADVGKRKNTEFVSCVLREAARRSWF